MPTCKQAEVKLGHYREIGLVLVSLGINPIGSGARSVTGSRLVGSDHRACRQLWEDYVDFRVAQLDSTRLSSMVA